MATIAPENPVLTVARDFGADLTNKSEQANNKIADRAATKAAPGAGAGKVRPIVVSVEAAIGTGKSTLLRMLETEKAKWVVVQEPVDLWQSVGGEHNLLQAFYSDPARYAFSFQTYCVLSRIQATAAALKAIPADTEVVVLERCWHSDRNTFAEMLRGSNKISPMEWCLYDEWYKFAIANAPTIDGHIYLSCDPSTCMNRLRKRDRSAEVGVTEDYQTQLIAKHEEWLTTVDDASVQRINVDNEFVSDVDGKRKVMDGLDGFIARLQAARADELKEE